MVAAMDVGLAVEAGVRGALDDLYREHAPAALRLALLLTGDRPLAEDLVHDAFVRVAGRLRTIRDPNAFDSYLQRTVVNLARSHFRHQRVVRRHVEREGHRRIAPPVELPDVATRDALWGALDHLSPRQRAAVVLRFYRDLPEREIAAVLGCRPGTVKSLLSRALTTLREVIADE